MPQFQHSSIPASPNHPSDHFQQVAMAPFVERSLTPLEVAFLHFHYLTTEHRMRQ